MALRGARTWRASSITLLSTVGVCSCGYIGLDIQDDLGHDMFTPDASGGVNTGGTGTGGLSEVFPSGGHNNTGGAGSGGTSGGGGDFSFGGFGGLGGFGGAGEPCEMGEVCDFSCVQSPCRVDCSAASTCEIASENVSQIVMRCREGATCEAIGANVPSLEFVCQGPGDCASKCNGAGQCAAQCVGTGSCSLDCQASDCSVQCSGASQCVMIGGAADKHICSGTKQYCANGVTTCNRACP